MIARLCNGREESPNSPGQEWFVTRTLSDRRKVPQKRYRQPVRIGKGEMAR